MAEPHMVEFVVFGGIAVLGLILIILAIWLFRKKQHKDAATMMLVIGALFLLIGGGLVLVKVSEMRSGHHRDLPESSHVALVMLPHQGPPLPPQGPPQGPPLLPPPTL